ncbi:MAG TPA: hypothetical protein VJ180_15855 [Pyrinomonadaceae bacterium]|nr:hypothetical protein [Pyrinomonadaceae bacterium]
MYTYVEAGRAGSESAERGFEDASRKNPHSTALPKKSINESIGG